MVEAHMPVDRAAAPPSGFARDLVAGAITGQVAGLVMAAAVMAVFVIFLGTSPLYPVQVIGSFALGDSALVGFNLKAILAGLVLHQLGPSLFWGVAFALLVRATGARAGVLVAALGVATGAASQAVDVELVLPFAMTALHGHNIWAEQVPAFWSWAAHLVFGLGLAVHPWVVSRMGPRRAA